MMERIEVKIHCDEIPLRSGPAEYFDAVEKKLAASGVEFSDGEPVGGTLMCMNDPRDFGMSIWVFTPNVKGQGDGQA